MTVELDSSAHEALVAFLTWHSLADEIVCAAVATGLRHAPNREAREALLRQMREEHAHSNFMAKLIIEDHGGVVPEELSEMVPIRAAILDLANESWLSYLAGFCASIDGIYGYPWSRAVMTAKVKDPRYMRFYDTVLFPQEIGHYNFARGELTRVLELQDNGLKAELRDIAATAYGVYVDFIQTSFPYLEGVGAQTDQILEKTRRIKNTYWPREFGFAIDEDEATPDSDVVYGPGM
jgi:hypothetical protein